MFFITITLYVYYSHNFIFYFQKRRTRSPFTTTSVKNRQRDVLEKYITLITILYSLPDGFWAMIAAGFNILKFIIFVPILG